MTPRLFFLLLFSTASLHAQMMIVQSVNTSKYPAITAKVFAFDTSAASVSLQPISDRNITEASSSSNATIPATLICQPSVINKPVSALLAFDVSTFNAVELMRAGARAWVRAMDFGSSECALSAFCDRAYIVQDLTSDTTRLLKSISSFVSLQGTNHTAAFLDGFSGAVPVLSRGRFPRMVIMVSDGESSVNDSVVIENIQRINAVVHVVMLGAKASPGLRAIASRSGGVCVENITDSKTISYVFRALATIARGAEPCVFSWQALSNCDERRTLLFDARSLKLRDTASYVVPDALRRRLTLTPSMINMGHVAADVDKDTVLNLIARGDTVRITNIQSTDTSRFSIVSPKGIVVVPQDSTLKVHIRFHSKDILRRVEKILIESDACNEVVAYVEADTAYHSSIVPRIVIPRAGTRLLAGMETPIIWQGVMPTDTVNLEYSLNAGQSWKSVNGFATGLEYQWMVPDTAVAKAMLRVSAVGSTSFQRTDTLSIIRPNITLHPLDMQKVNLGSQKEMLMLEAVTHDASSASSLLSIDSLHIDSTQFEVVGGLPVRLVRGGRANLEFRFTPSAAGAVRSPLKIYTNEGAASTTIQGEGVQPRATTPYTINMGAVPLGSRRDTAISNILCISAATSLRVTHVDVDFPDEEQFSTSGTFPLELNTTNQCVPLTVHFAPHYRGRTTARLILATDKDESYELTLTGEGICGLPSPEMQVTIPPVIAALIGDTVSVPVLMTNVPPEFRAMKRSYEMDISFNKTILYPLSPLSLGDSAANERVIAVPGKGFTKDDTLLILRFITALGDADSTMLNIDAFHWTDDCLDSTRISSGVVRLKNVCKEGGTRLFLYSDSLAFRSITPNPANDELNLAFSLRERGQSTMVLIDMFGREVARLMDEEMDTGNYRMRVSIATIPPGRYLAVLTTPTKRISTVIGVLR